MYMHIIRAKHPKISLFTRSITQKWDSTDLIWAHVVSVHCPHCRPTERSRRQPLVPPYSCSPLWTLWKVSGAELTSTTKYAWKSKIPNSAETRSHLFGGSAIVNEISWASSMTFYIAYLLHWLCPSGTAGLWWLRHMLGRLISSPPQGNIVITCKRPSGGNTHHLPEIPTQSVQKCCLYKILWPQQHTVAHIVCISLSFVQMQIDAFFINLKKRLFCKIDQLWARIISKIKNLRVFNIQIYLISLIFNRKKLKKVNLGLFLIESPSKIDFYFNLTKILNFFRFLSQF